MPLDDLLISVSSRFIGSLLLYIYYIISINVSGLTARVVIAWGLVSLILIIAEAKLENVANFSLSVCVTDWLSLENIINITTDCVEP